MALSDRYPFITRLLVPLLAVAVLLPRAALAGETTDDGMTAEVDGTTMGDETGTTTDGEETASDSQTGLGLLVGVLSLLAIAAVALRRRSGERVDPP